MLRAVSGVTKACQTSGPDIAALAYTFQYFAQTLILEVLFLPETFTFD